MITAIQNGSFDPDATRSGMLTPGALPYIGGTPVPGTGLPVATALLPPNAKGQQMDEQGGMESPGSVWSLVARNEEDMKLFGGTSGCESSDAGQPNEPDALTDTTEENSQQSTSSSEVEENGVEQHRDLLDAVSAYVINRKSLVVHLVRTPGILQCGRKLILPMTKFMKPMASDVPDALMSRRLECVRHGKKGESECACDHTTMSALNLNDTSLKVCAISIMTLLLKQQWICAA